MRLVRTAILVWCWLGLGPVARGSGQTPEAATEAPAPTLRAELHMERALLTPAQPAWIRFSLTNVGDEAVELPASRATDGSTPVILPPGLIFGEVNQPALHLSYENQRQEVLKSPTVIPATDTSLTLPPRASIGAEIDFRSLTRDARYLGRFKVEWRPPIGKTPPATIEFQVETRKRAVVYTDFGNMTFNLAYDKAPRNVENFLELVRDKFYDGKQIHRIVPDGLFQGGSPDNTSAGLRPDGKTFPLELHDARFEAGTLAMARKSNDPNSASCQFFVTLARLPDLDGKYTIIGSAADDATLRTLERIAAQPVNDQGRPMQPVIIFSMRLIDVEELGPRRLELKSP